MRIFESFVKLQSQDLPVVLYSLPGQNETYLIGQKDGQLHRPENYRESGFLFAPFNKDRDPVLIRSDQREKQLLVAPTGNAAIIPKRFEEEKGKDSYCRLVSMAVDSIRSGELKKVVLSRYLQLEVEGEEALTIYQNMQAKYPNAFCYLLFHPQLGMWCGASPEIFAEVDSGNLRTVALAATRVGKGNEATPWGQKEKEEQAMVSSYIASALATKVSDLKIGETRTVEAGHLEHLQTEITARLPTGVLKEVIDALHPTPAVCGIPLAASLAFINKNEGYERGYYTGYLGPLNLDKGGGVQARLFVNLRCMHLLEGKARIYVGAGITGDSQPEQEWEETRQKSKTMLSLLGKIR